LFLQDQQKNLSQSLENYVNQCSQKEEVVMVVRPNSEQELTSQMNGIMDKLAARMSTMMMAEVENTKFIIPILIDTTNLRRSHSFK
jgi:hypothetical protein